MKTGLFRIKNLIEAELEGKKSPAKLKKMQVEKLKELLHHAYRFVPFYHRRFNELGLKPDDFQSPADLVKLPTMSKEELRDTPLLETMAENVSRAACVEVTTSGSTGRPLRIYYTREDFSRLNMNWLRPLLAHGVKPWQAKLEISGPHNLPGRGKWYQRLGFWRRRGVSIFSSPEEWVEAWRRYRPEILYGYSGSLKLLARFALEHGIGDIRPRFVFGVSDQVDVECRELAAAAFRKPLVDLYGAAEGGCIAWECPDGDGYHINADTVIVEFLRGGRPVTAGEKGTIVITNLHSFAMPVIRYELGDIGTPADSGPRCGRSLPLLRGIEGRSDAQILLPSGAALSPMFFFGIMKSVKGVRDWKVVQDDPGRVTVYAVPSGDYQPDCPARIRERLAENVGERLVAEVEIVRALPPDPSGKARAVVSRLKPIFGSAG